MADTKNEVQKPESFAEGAKTIGDKLLYELSYKISRNIPSNLQNLQVDLCDHVGAKYPSNNCIFPSPTSKINPVFCERTLAKIH